LIIGCSHDWPKYLNSKRYQNWSKEKAKTPSIDLSVSDENEVEESDTAAVLDENEIKETDKASDNKNTDQNTETNDSIAGLEEETTKGSEVEEEEKTGEEEGKEEDNETNETNKNDKDGKISKHRPVSVLDCFGLKQMIFN